MKLFPHLLVIPWADFIWFKGLAINLSIFTWMAMLKGLKTLDQLQARGIGTNFPSFILPSGYGITQSHFFWMLVHMEYLKKYSPSWQLFPPSSHFQVLQYASTFDRKIKKKIYLLIVTASVYCILKEHNSRAFNINKSTSHAIISNVVTLVNHKLSRWKFSSSWPSDVQNLWLLWSSAGPLANLYILWSLFRSICVFSELFPLVELGDSIQQYVSFRMIMYSSCSSLDDMPLGGFLLIPFALFLYL